MIRFNPEDNSALPSKINGSNINKQNNRSIQISKSKAESDSVSFGGRKSAPKTVKGIILGFVAAITALFGSGSVSKTQVQQQPEPKQNTSYVEVTDDTPENESEVKVKDNNYTYNAGTPDKVAKPATNSTPSLKPAVTETIADSSEPEKAQPTVTETVADSSEAAKSESVITETIADKAHATETVVPDENPETSGTGVSNDKQGPHIKDKTESVALMKYGIPDDPGTFLPDEPREPEIIQEEFTNLKYGIPDDPSTFLPDEPREPEIIQEEFTNLKYGIPDDPSTFLPDEPEPEIVGVSDEETVLKYGIPDDPSTFLPDEPEPEVVGVSDKETVLKYGIPDDPGTVSIDDTQSKSQIPEDIMNLLNKLKEG